MEMFLGFEKDRTKIFLKFPVSYSQHTDKHALKIQCNTVVSWDGNVCEMVVNMVIHLLHRRSLMVSMRCPEYGPPGRRVIARRVRPSLKMATRRQKVSGPCLLQGRSSNTSKSVTKWWTGQRVCCQ